MLYLPHRLEWHKAVSPVGGDRRVLPPQAAPVRTVAAQLTPERSGTVFSADGVELSRPHMVITSVREGETMAVGDILIGLGELARRRFVIATPPRIFRALGPASHVELVADEVQFANG